MKKILLFVHLFITLICYTQGKTCNLKSLADDLVGATQEFKVLINTAPGFNAYRYLAEEASTLRTNIEELTLVSKNIEAVNIAGGYLKWKNIADAENDLIDILKPLKVKYNDEVLNALTKDFPNTSDLKRVVDGDLVDSWKLLDDANVSSTIKRNPTNLEVINNLGERVNKTNLSDAFSNSTNPQKLIDDLGKTDNYYSSRSGIEITVDANADRVRVSRNSFDADADDIASLRIKYNAGAGKNIATGKGNIGGDDLNLETVSGQVTPQNQAQKGNFTPPDDPHYQGVLGYENHTEQKIVEYLRDRYKNDFNVEGTLEIVSERPFCDNCIDVVDQFQAEFPNITVIRVEVQPRY